jgi:transposase-like protein
VSTTLRRKPVSAKPRRKRVSTKPPRKLPSRRAPAHRTYSPALLANGRRRYEQTPESVASIAADFGIHHYSLIRLAKREHWVRYQPGPRTLPASAQLLEEAQKLERDRLAANSPSPESADNSSSQQSEEPCTAAPEHDALPPLAQTVERLHRAVLAELATVEAMRAQLGRSPRESLEAARTAQTLSNLTDILRKLTGLQCAAGSAASGDDYDDMPADIDEFRRDLAHRIDALFKSGIDGGVAEDNPAGPAAAPGA